MGANIFGCVIRLSRNNMSQKQLILEWIKEFGKITPAKMSGYIYKGIMFGSESSKRCRELREEGKLQSYSDGKFEVFSISKQIPVEKWMIEQAQKTINDPKFQQQLFVQSQGGYFNE